MTTLITNCRLVTPGLELESASILVENDRIRAVLPAGAALPAADRIIDAAGLTAVPGFVDVHCHGRNNADFSDGSVEGVNRIGRGKLEEGVTTLLPTTLTLPEQDLAASLRSIAAYDGKGCRMPGVHL